jgi:hypothetical protein
VKVSLAETLTLGLYYLCQSDITTKTKEIEMANKTYSVKGNRTAADVAAGREEVVETGYSLEEAKIAAIEIQKTGEFVAAWIEEEEAKASSIHSAKFAAVVAGAKAAAADSPRWLRAIDRAAEGILSGELIVTILANGALVTSPNGKYHANGACQCKAFVNGHKECKHRAAARLIELYESEPEPKPAPKALRIIRSIEHDRFGRRHTVVRCDGWAV